MNAPIESYALLSDLETAAMVGRDGAVDWLCLPRFDSPACLAALVGTGDNGFWRVAPVGGGECARRGHRRDTLVLDTVWETPTGAVRVTDFMPPRTRLPCLVRVVEGLTGAVNVRSELRLRFHQGRVVPWIRAAGHCAVSVAGPDAVWLGVDGTVPVSGEVADSRRDFTVTAGRRLALTLVWAPSHRPGPPAPLVVPAETGLKETVDFWRRWAARCRYQGPWRDAVVRSLITLKALTYAPTGGIVAAPTTSLPGSIGGGRNWDHRYCWLRDSTLTLSCLLRSGYREEAAAWLDWLVRAIAGDPAGLQTVYGVAGQRLLPETEAPWLSGYEGSRPVRFGNSAAGQFQLDVYGEVLDTLCLSLRAGIPMPAHVWDLVETLMGFLQRHWRDPDQGLWQTRGPRRQFVHSKVMAWVAADRALRMGRLLGRNGSSGEWRAMREQVHREVCRRGWDPAQGAFAQAYGSPALDAAALLLPRLGFLPPGDERVRGTVHALGRRLGYGGFVRRYAPADGAEDLPPGDGGADRAYDDSHHPSGDAEQAYGDDPHHASGRAEQQYPPGCRPRHEPRPEGAFVACSLWYADALAATGRPRQAVAAFERVLAVRNDVGLLAEQWDPDAGRQLGNAPHALSHLALVDTAFTLSSADRPGAAGAHRGLTGPGAAPSPRGPAG